MFFREATSNSLMGFCDARISSSTETTIRTAYSLRHTYICMRLMEGADIYQIAKNCRTSVEMIEKFYAAHIKNTLDAAAINVMRPRTARQPIIVPKDGNGTRQQSRSAPAFARTAAMPATRKSNLIRCYFWGGWPLLSSSR